MGLYLNQNNENFKKYFKNEVFIDKSMLIEFTNKKIDSDDCFICVTRPRRFGKTMGLNMLNAYYSKGCNSIDLFKNLKIYNDLSFAEHLNKHNVIYISIINIFKTVNDKNDFISDLNFEIIKDLKKYYNDLNIEETQAARYINYIYNETGEKFIFLIDEWDYPFTRAEQDICDKYMDFLAGLFKGNVPYVELAYMTGVLPIKKYSVTSDLNNFKEYSMLKPKQLAPFFGFTDEEVKKLCSNYNMDYNKMKEWYDGYKLGDYEIYNPLSVVSAIENHEFGDYWNSTSSVDAVISYMQNRDYSLKTELVELISGEKTSCNITSFNGDIKNITNRDKALTVLCHLGYLGYIKDNNVKGRCYVPNNELRIELGEVLKELNYSYIYKFIDQSLTMQEALFNNDTKTINEILDDNHKNFCNQLDKNVELSLKYVVVFSFMSLRDNYYEFQELNNTLGRADLLYLPITNNGDPLIVIELKYNKIKESAITQIKEKNYPEAIKGYKGKVILLGITYDDNLVHDSIIESIEI